MTPDWIAARTHGARYHKKSPSYQQLIASGSHAENPQDQRVSKMTCESASRAKFNPMMLCHVLECYKILYLLN